jgi:hypothetical protein
MFFPNLEARLSLIHSDDAGQILTELSQTKISGPLNVCSQEPIRLSDLISKIESAVQQKAVFAQIEEPENHSPYGLDSGWFMAIEKLRSLGLKTQAIDTWMKPLLAQLANELRD